MMYTKNEKKSQFSEFISITSSFYKKRLYQIVHCFKRNNTLSHIIIGLKFFMMFLPLFSNNGLFHYFFYKDKNLSSFKLLHFTNALKNNNTLLISLQSVIFCLNAFIFIYLIAQFIIYYQSYKKIEQRKKKPLQIKQIDMTNVHANIIQIPNHNQKVNIVILSFSFILKIYIDVLLVPSIMISFVELNPLSILSSLMILLIGLVCVDSDYDYLLNSSDCLAKRHTKTSFISFVLIVFLSAFSVQIDSIKSISLLESIICLIIFLFKLIWRHYYDTSIRRMVQFGYIYIFCISLTFFICYNSDITQFFSLMVLIFIPICFKFIFFLEDLHSDHLNSRIYVIKQILIQKQKTSSLRLFPFEVDELMRLIFKDLTKESNISKRKFNVRNQLQKYFLVFQDGQDPILFGSKKYQLKEEVINGEIYVKKEQAFGNDTQLKESLKQIFRKLFKFLLFQTQINQEMKAEFKFFYMLFLFQIQKIPQQFMIQAFQKDRNFYSSKIEQMVEVLLNSYQEKLEQEKYVEGNASSFSNTYLLPILFEQITFQTQGLLEKAVNLKLSLLQMMSQKYFDIQALNNKLLQIQNIRNKIVNHLNSLVTMNQKSEELHYLYSNYLENLSFSENDITINQKQKQLNYIQKNFFSEETGVAFISVQKDHKSIVKKASMQFCKFFDVSEKEILNSEIDRFIPVQIQQRHRIYVQRFLENPNLTYANINKDLLFGSTKQGYIFPLEMNLRFTQFIQGSEYNNDFGITAFVKNKSNQSEYILYDNSKSNKIVSLTKNLHEKVFPHIKEIKRIELNKYFPFLKNKINIHQLYNYEKITKVFHNKPSNLSYQFNKSNSFKNYTTMVGGFQSFKSQDTKSILRHTTTIDLDGNVASVGKNSETALSSRYPQSLHSQFEFTTFNDDEDEEENEQQLKKQQQEQNLQIEEDYPQNFSFILIVEKPSTEFQSLKQKLSLNSIQSLYSINKQHNTVKNYLFYSMRINVKPFHDKKLNLNYLEIYSIVEVDPIQNSQLILPILSNNELAEIKTNQFMFSQQEIDRIVNELSQTQNYQAQQSKASSISEQSEEYDEMITPQIQNQSKESDQQKLNQSIISLKHIQINSENNDNHLTNKLKSRSNIEEVVEAREDFEHNESVPQNDIMLKSSGPFSPHFVSIGDITSTNNIQLLQSQKTGNIISNEGLNESEQINNRKEPEQINDNINEQQKMKQIQNNKLNKKSNSSNKIQNPFNKENTVFSRNKIMSSSFVGDYSINPFLNQQKFYSKQSKLPNNINEQSDLKLSNQRNLLNIKDYTDKDLQEVIEVSSTHSKSSNSSTTKKKLTRIIKTKRSLFVMKVISIVGYLCVSVILAVILQQFFQILTIFDNQIEDFKKFDWPMVLQSEMFLIQKNENFSKLLGGNIIPIALTAYGQILKLSKIEMTSSFKNVIDLLSNISSPDHNAKIFGFVRDAQSNFTFVPQRSIIDNNFNLTNCTVIFNDTAILNQINSLNITDVDTSGIDTISDQTDAKNDITFNNDIDSINNTTSINVNTPNIDTTAINDNQDNNQNINKENINSPSNSGQENTDNNVLNNEQLNEENSNGSSEAKKSSDSDIYNCTNSTAAWGGDQLFDAMINQTYNLDYSLLLLSQTMFNYAFLNETHGTSERGFITNIRYIKEQLNEVYKLSKNSMYSQLVDSQEILNQLMIVIMVVMGVCLVVVIPLYSFIQIKREQILKLFGTFDSQKLEYKILQLNTFQYLQYQIKRNSVSQQQKQNQSKIQNGQNAKKQNLSQISSLPKIKKSLFIVTAILYGLSIIYPILNEFITSQFTKQGKYNTELMANIFEIQSFIHESIAQNYFCLILKAFPNKKSYDINIQIQELSQIYDKGKNLLISLQKTVQDQHEIQRYEQNLYDDFLFLILEKDICTPLNDFNQYNLEEYNISIKECKTIKQGILSQGLQISLKKFLELFPDMISLYSIDDKDTFIAQLKKYQESFDFIEFNTFSTYLAKVISILRYFIIQNNSNFYNYMRIFQISILTYQIFIMVVIFYYGWISFYRYLDYSIFQTKLLLTVMDVNSLLDNLYVYNYLKKNVDV